jgi:hypothetical protein
MMKRAEDRHHNGGGDLRRRRTKDGAIMKRKILAVGLFSLCCLALFTSSSQAFFGLFSPYSPWHPHNRYLTQITCRPYNAFTPICWGNLVCDGCCPQPCGVASGCLPMTFGTPPFAANGYGPSCGMPSFAPQQGYAGDMPPMMSGPPMQQMPMQPMPNINSTPFTPPMPTPMPNGPGTAMAYPYNGVSQANYYQYVPQYYPNYYTPNYYQPAPYYWYGYGR